MKTEPESSDVLVFVEKDGAERFKIRSDQLDHIGEKLRGFSIFNSIVLPAFVAVMTVLLTGLFQYISWMNTVDLQNATEASKQATEASEKTTAAIGRRRYATFLFVSSLREFVTAKLNLPTPGENTGITPSRPLTYDQDYSLDKLDIELKKLRFESYYEEIKRWNESIDQLLTDVDYALDRIIFMDANGAPEGKHEGVGEYYEKMKKINCSWSLSDSLKKFDLNPNSLKLRLAGINNCFIQLNNILSSTKNATSGELTWDTKYNNQLHKRVDDIQSMGSELRCYALHRIDYYNSKKAESIFNPALIWYRLTRSQNPTKEQQQAALKHFAETAERCNPRNRPT